MEKGDLILEKGDLIFGKGRSHFWIREISFLEKVLCHLSIIGALIRKNFRKNNSPALCCVQEIGEPYNLDHNDA